MARFSRRETKKTPFTHPESIKTTSLIWSQMQQSLVIRIITITRAGINMTRSTITALRAATECSTNRPAKNITLPMTRYLEKQTMFSKIRAYWLVQIHSLPEVQSASKIAKLQPRRPRDPLILRQHSSKDECLKAHRWFLTALRKHWICKNLALTKDPCSTTRSKMASWQCASSPTRNRLTTLKTIFVTRKKQWARSLWFHALATIWATSLRKVDHAISQKRNLAAWQIKLGRRFIINRDKRQVRANRSAPVKIILQESKTKIRARTKTLSDSLPHLRRKERVHSNWSSLYIRLIMSQPPGVRSIDFHSSSQSISFIAIRWCSRLIKPISWELWITQRPIWGANKTLCSPQPVSQLSKRIRRKENRLRRQLWMVKLSASNLLKMWFSSMPWWNLTRMSTHRVTRQKKNLLALSILSTKRILRNTKDTHLPRDSSLHTSSKASKLPLEKVLTTRAVKAYQSDISLNASRTGVASRRNWRSLSCLRTKDQLTASLKRYLTKSTEPMKPHQRSQSIRHHKYLPYSKTLKKSPNRLLFPTDERLQQTRTIGMTTKTMPHPLTFRCKSVTIRPWSITPRIQVTK